MLTFNRLYRPARQVLGHDLRRSSLGLFYSLTSSNSFSVDNHKPNDSAHTQDKYSSHPQRKKKIMQFSIDRSNLTSYIRPDIDPEDEKNEQKEKVAKEKLTPLAKDLLSFIQLKGPITVHEYISQTANHLVHGYYQSKTRTKIGDKQQGGDFITAPELSQLFGEMIGIYCLKTFQEMGQPPLLQLIECGPGKGTLMHDILKLSNRFPAFQQALHIHFVELSQSLRVTQLQKLLELSPSVSLADVLAQAKTHKTHLKTHPSNSIPTISDSNEEQDKSETHIEDNVTFNLPLINGKSVSVTWHSFLHQVPTTSTSPSTLFSADHTPPAPPAPLPCVIIGQEFLDAFPVHHFLYTEKGWREKLVDVDPSSSSPYHFRFVLSPNETPAIKSLLNQHKFTITNKVLNNPLFDRQGHIQDMGKVKPTVSSAHHTHANNRRTSGGFFTPEKTEKATEKTESPTEKETENAAKVETDNLSGLKIGDGLEISPLALATVEDMAKRLLQHATPQSKVLLIDYGEDFTQEDSLRAFFEHNQVHVLSCPGLADVTADVDFAQVRQVVRKYLDLQEKKHGLMGEKVLTLNGKKPHLEMLPLQTQGEFLMSLGIVERVQQLIGLDSTSEEDANWLFQSLKMLVQPDKMGKKFKVFQMVKK